MSGQVYLIIVGLVIFCTVLVSALISFRTITAEYRRKIKLDISVEQMIESENRIAQFFKKNNIQPGDSIQTIANALNIIDGGTNNNIPGRAQLSDPNADGKMVVVFKSGSDPKERLFDFAHECGHRINQDPTPATRPEGCNKAEVEQLADYVAAALLMPLDSVYNYLSNHHYADVSNRKKAILIRKLCKKYEVTEMIALRRVKEVYVIKQSQMNMCDDS